MVRDCAGVGVVCGRPHHRLTVTLHRDSAEQYKQKNRYKRFFLSLNTPTRTLSYSFHKQCNAMKGFI